MTVHEIVRILQARVHTGADRLDLEIKSACGADLMSDVMAFVKDDVVLLTGLVTTQSIRTAELLDIPVVVFVRGKNPNEELKQLAHDANIILLSTDYTMFIACGSLYEAGIRRGGAREIAG